MKKRPQYYPIRVYVAGARPNVQAELDRAIQMWNSAVGATVLVQVADGANNAVPIRLANAKNEWYGYPDVSVAQDEEAEYTGLTSGPPGQGVVHGTPSAFIPSPGGMPLTLAHELGHALGLFHPFPTATAEHYVPATYAKAERAIEHHHPALASHVAPFGIMGNEMNPNKPGWRGNGPSPGEVAFLREKIGIPPPSSGAATWDRVRSSSPPLGRRALDRFAKQQI